MLKLSPPGSRMWILAALCVAVVMTLAVALLLEVAPPHDARTVLQMAHVVLSFDFNDDSWGPLWNAFDSWDKSPGRDIYAETFDKGIKYQYPPTAVFIMMGPMQPPGGRPFLYFDLVSIGFLLLSFLCAERLLAAGGGEATGPRRWVEFAARLGLVALLGMLFWPMTYGLHLGQVQLWIDGLFALALLGWSRGLRIAPALLIAAASLLKPQFSLFLLWAAFRGEWRFALTLGFAGAAGLLASFWVFGFDDFLHYIRVLGVLADRGEAFYPNQSFNGLLNRLMSLSDPVAYNNLEWRGDHFPPPTPFVKIGTSLTSALILGLALFHRRKASEDEGRMLDFCAMALSATIASPIAWEHHYGITFAIFAVLLLRAANSPPALAALAVAYVLVSQNIALVNQLAATPFNFLQSPILFGGLIMLVLLHCLRSDGVSFRPSGALAPAT
ncbi:MULTISPECIES: glycosyltransferase family 87 protein [unclassified Phenylobacterium]|uniref:glycosyltransferase family 87 protein n=1 Tax=unclassified Phenylobacterium TaxID=2640670 RepID=UPI000AAC0657|nr:MULTISPECIES: glycosyltransferase family 87 protein [unclassified Phenylobacterium]